MSNLTKALTAAFFILVLSVAPVRAADLAEAQQAKKLLEQALSLSDPRDASQRSQLFDEAALLIRKALAANSEDASALLLYGNILYSDGIRFDDVAVLGRHSRR